MDCFCFYKAFGKLCDDVAAIRTDIATTKDLQAKINAAVEKSETVEQKARDTLASPQATQ